MGQYPQSGGILRIPHTEVFWTLTSTCILCRSIAYRKFILIHKVKQAPAACSRCLFKSRPVSRVLSLKTTIYLGLPLPAGSSHLQGTAGPALCPHTTVLLRIEFTASTCLHATSGLLPHLSTITAASCGSLFLLHLSEGHPWRALPVILALWSPDFPHVQAFALCPRSFSLLTRLF